jgi:LysR family hydrogen peroxide-inducible transcriptional activator
MDFDRRNWHPTYPQLRAFVTLTQERSFGAAAHVLGISQPAVSVQIRDLESSVGFSLFQRGSGGVELTSVGASLIPFARRALDALADFTTAAAPRRVDSVLRLGAIPTLAPYLLPKIVAGLGNTISLQLSEQRTDVLIGSLRDHSIDLALLALPITHSDIETCELFTDTFHLAVPINHPWAWATGIDLGDMNEFPVLLIEDGHCLRGQAEEICANARISNTYDVGAAGLATVCQMVAAGNGVTLLPECAVELEARVGTGIAIAGLADPQPFRTIGLAWSKNAVQKEKLIELSASIRQLLMPVVPNPVSR